MNVLMLLQAGEGPDAGTVAGVVWLALVGLGILGVIVLGFTAKKINNITNPSYGKAFFAQFLAGAFAMSGFFVFGLFLDAPVWVVMAMSFAIIPMVIYRIVFSCMWSEALILWFVTTAVQAAAMWGLVLAGVLTFAALTGG